MIDWGKFISLTMLGLFAMAFLVLGSYFALIVILTLGDDIVSGGFIKNLVVGIIATLAIIGVSYGAGKLLSKLKYLNVWFGS